MSVEPVESAITTLPAKEGARLEGRWISSAPYDLLFFILAPLTGIVLVVIAPGGTSLLVLAVGALLGIPHYLSTYTFYFWDDLGQDHRRHWAEFFLAPLGIVAAYTVMLVFGFTALPFFAIYWWNAFHIARQSCGILSIYRHRAGITSPAAKHLNNAVILAVNGCFALWNIEWNPTVFPIFKSISPILPTALRVTVSAFAVYALVRLLLSWRSQLPTMPEVTFLASSLLLFAPYLWVRDWNRAGFGVLTGHFIQYLGLVWLVHRRKFATIREGSLPQRVLAKVSTDWRFLVVAWLLTAVVFLGLPKGARRIPWKDAYTWLSGVMIFLHFYLDGLFWAFKRPEVRRAIAPFLIPRTSGARSRF
jgi:hypothetical protein